MYALNTRVNYYRLFLKNRYGLNISENVQHKNVIRKFSPFMWCHWLGSGWLQNEPRQGSSFSLLWVLKCLLRPRASQKDFTHMEQQYGFSPVWQFVWLVRLNDWENDLVHKEQVNGFSPVWVPRCIFRTNGSENDFLHTIQY